MGLCLVMGAVREEKGCRRNNGGPARNPAARSGPQKPSPTVEKQWGIGGSADGRGPGGGGDGTKHSKPLHLTVPHLDLLGTWQLLVSRSACIAVGCVRRRMSCLFQHRQAEHPRDGEHSGTTLQRMRCTTSSVRPVGDGLCQCRVLACPVQIRRPPISFPPIVRRQ